MGSERTPHPTPPADFDRAATRLLAAILTGRRPGAAFPLRVEAALAASLALLDRDRKMARLLTAEPDPESQLAARCSSWAETFGDLLRETAQSADLRLPPPFLEPHLIAGIGWRLRCAVEDPRQPSLEQLLPSLLEFVLLYYLDPPDVSATVRALTAARSSPPSASSPNGEPRRR